MLKKAFITGVTGQDGSYLLEMLLDLGYEVHAILRRASVFTTHRIEQHLTHPNFKTYHGDLTDSSNLHSLLSLIEPDEIYNLGAQSHVAVSFEVPEYTAEVDALGALRLLNATKDLRKSPRYYQASTSELFGGFIGSAPQSESTPFHPRSPYATAKLYAYWATVNYRDAYGLFACNGILFNHESPRRGETFVTRKITMAVSRIALGYQDTLTLGNLNAMRDWGYAKDYVRCMWLMLQQSNPDDYVVSTGKAFSVRQFTEWAFEAVGIGIEWLGKGLDEKGIDSLTGQVRVTVDSRYYRPLEVDYLCGDSTKAKQRLGWVPETDIKALIKLMVDSDMELAKGERNLV